jgi:type IV pilus assembly protein PilE
MDMNDRQTGFTLIELIVAMVILAVLAAIAIPSYTNYVLQSHRAEAKQALLDLASFEERYFSANNAYTTNPQNLGYTQTSAPFPIGTGGYYVVQQMTATVATAPTSTTAGTPPTFSITANATGNQTKDTACNAFTVNSAGQQTAQNSSNADNSAYCWQN